MMKVAMVVTATNGSTFTMIFSTASPPMPEATNRFSPSGGVMKPIDKVQITTMPTWVGSAPVMYITGNNTGTKIRMAARVSMNMPTKSRNTITNAQMM